MTADTQAWQAVHMIIPLDEAVDPDRVGRKAAMLARLRAAGERVPDGFVIPVDRLDEVEAGALGESLRHLGGGPVAVRSSAVAEDLDDASHAGQYVSVLGVSGTAEAVTEAAGQVANSAQGGMAVLVQPMIDARYAGVAFSANPVTGDDEVVVTAVAGLADRLMEGSATGDEWVVGQDGARRRTGDTVDEALVVEVARTCRRLAASLGHPVDVEWVHDGTALHVVQCRPITALPMRPQLDYPDGSWQKDATHHPGPIAPLVASMANVEETAVERWTARAGLLIEGLEQRVVGGELYVRPVPLGGGSGGAKAPPALLVGILSRLHPAFRRRTAAAARFLESDVFAAPATVWRERWLPELAAGVERLRSIDLAALDRGGLRAHVAEVSDLASRAADMHFDLFIPYLVRMHELTSFCEDRLGWDAATAQRLLSGRSAASSEPTRELGEIAERVAASPTAMAVLDEPDALSRLAAADAAIGAALDAWMDRHGFRTVRYDWSSPTIAELPGLVATMLRAEIRSRTQILDASGPANDARARLGPADAAAFEQLLDEARAVYPVREDNVQWTSGSVGALFRRAFLEVGRRLAERSSISAADDVFMLTRDEAFGALAASLDLRSTVRRRKAERAWVAAHPGPLALGEPPGPPPDIKYVPESLRRVNGALLWAMDLEFSPIAPADDAEVLTGLPGAAGTYTGPARIVRSEADFRRVEPGDVVVCPITNPSWSVLFGIAGGFVCDAGGPLSHTAVLAREYDVPSVLAVGNATGRLTDGQMVQVDGARGTVRPV